MSVTRYCFNNISNNKNINININIINVKKHTETQKEHLGSALTNEWTEFYYFYYIF